jgi:DNA-binding LacI/PurR family transcriptional regulator
MDSNGLTPRVVEMPSGASAMQISGAVDAQKADALVFADHDLALAGIDVLRRLRKRVPVIVFDDDGNLRLLAPFLTTIAQPIKEMAEYIMQHIHGGANGEGISVVLPTRLVSGKLAAKIKAISSQASTSIQ